MDWSEVDLRGGSVTALWLGVEKAVNVKNARSENLAARSDTTLYLISQRWRGNIHSIHRDKDNFPLHESISTSLGLVFCLLSMLVEIFKFIDLVYNSHILTRTQFPCCASGVRWHPARLSTKSTVTEHELQKNVSEWLWQNCGK